MPARDHREYGMFGMPDDDSLYARLKDSAQEGDWPDDERRRAGGNIAAGYLCDEADGDLTPGELLQELGRELVLGATTKGAVAALLKCDEKHTMKHWQSVFDSYGGDMPEGCG